MCPVLDLETASFETLVKMSYMPKAFFLALLPELQPDKFANADVCEKLEKRAKGTLHILFYRVLACQPSAKWPRLAHQLRIFRAMVFEQRKAKSCNLQGVVVAETS